MTSYLAATRDRFLLGLKYADYRTQGGFMTISHTINAPVVMTAGGLLFLAAISISLGSGAIRRIYFPGPAIPAAAGSGD